MNDWIEITKDCYVRRSMVTGLSIAGTDVLVDVGGERITRVFPNQTEARSFLEWMLRKTDNPAEVLSAEK